MLYFLLAVLFFQLLLIGFFYNFYIGGYYGVKEEFEKKGLFSNRPEDRKHNLAILNERVSRDDFTKNVLYGLGIICGICICIVLVMLK